MAPLANPEKLSSGLFSPDIRINALDPDDRDVAGGL